MSKVEISKKLVLVNTLSSAVAKVVNITCLLWSLQYLLGRIDKAEFDIYPVVVVVMMIVPLLTAALTAGLGRFVVEAYAQNDEPRVTQIISTIFPLVLVAALLVIAGGAIICWKIEHLLTLHGHVWDAQVMLMLMFIGVAIKIATGPFQVAPYVCQRFVLQNSINIGCDVLYQAVLLVLLLGVSPRVLWMPVAMLVSTVTNVVVTTIVSMRMMPSLRFRLSAVRLGTIGHLMAFNAWSFVRQMAGSLFDCVVPILLKNVAPIGDNTTFYVSSLPNKQIQSFSSLMGASLEPVMTAMHGTGMKEVLGNTYVRGNRYRLWLSMLPVMPLAVFAYEVIDLYGHHKYPQAAPLMLMFLAMIPIMNANAMIGEVAHAKAQPGPLARIILFQNLLLVAAIFVAVWGLQMGAMGAGIATVGVMAVTYPLLWWPLGRKLAEVDLARWIRQTIIPGLMPAVAAGAVLLALRFALHPHTWLMLGLCSLIGVATYVLVLLRFSLEPCDKKDFATAWMLLKSKLRKLRSAPKGPADGGE